MMSIWRRFFLSFLLFLFGVAIGLLLLVTTETGAKFTLNMGAKLGLVPIAFQDLRGNLISSITLTNASYKTRTVNIAISRLTVKWHPLVLLQKTLLLDHLSLQHAVVTILNPAKQPQAQSPGFSLPFAVQINQLDLTDITVITGNPQQPLHVKSLTGNITAGKKIDADIYTDLLSPLEMALHFNIHGKLSDYHWQLKLKNSISDWALHGTGNQQAIALITDQAKLLDGELAGSAHIQWFPDLRWNFSFKANTVNLNLIAADLPRNLSLTANSAGTPSAFNLAVTGLQGQLKNFPLSGYLRLSAQAKTAGLQTNGLSSYLQYTNFNLDTQLQLGNARANIQGTLAQRWDLQFNVYADELHKLVQQLSGSVKLQGTLTGDAAQPQLNAKITLKQFKTLWQPNAILQGDFTLMSKMASANTACSLFNSDYSHCNLALLLRLTRGEFTYPLNNKKITFPIMGNLDIRYDSVRLNSQLDLSAYGKKILDLQLALPKYKLIFPLPPTQPVTGKLAAHIEQSQLKDILPTNIHPTNSIVTANVQIDGTVNQPRLQGLIHIKSDAINIPKVAVKLQNLHTEIALNNNTIIYSGSVKSGSGNLQLQGKSLLTDHGLDSSIALTGTQFQVSNTPKMQISVSPQLTILSDIHGWRITGNILVPTVTIKQNQINHAITLPSETIIIDQQGQRKQTQSLPMAMQVTVELGDNVQLDINELSGRVAGKLDVVDDSQGNTIATGMLNLVNASYNLQGEKLAITQGNIIFMNSPIDNPQLDIRATKKIDYHSQEQIFSQQDNLTVGISVKGTVENPKITLFSDPASWSQADILSLILIGQPASQAEGSQVQLLARAAQALTSKNGVGVNSMTGQLQRMFGLSELGLNSEVNNLSGNYSQGTSLVVGKSLSPRLNLSYSLNVFNSINTLRVRYLLNKHWFIQTESNAIGSGADIIYTVGK